jgi:hypothetical protein
MNERLMKRVKELWLMSEQPRWGTSVSVNKANLGPCGTIDPIQYQELAVKGMMHWQLTITVHPDLVINNPEIVLVCGHRRWQAIEDRREEETDEAHP